MHLIEFVNFCIICCRFNSSFLLLLPNPETFEKRSLSVIPTKLVLDLTRLPLQGTSGQVGGWIPVCTGMTIETIYGKIQRSPLYGEQLSTFKGNGVSVLFEEPLKNVAEEVANIYPGLIAELEPQKRAHSPQLAAGSFKKRSNGNWIMNPKLSLLRTERPSRRWQEATLGKIAEMA